MALHPVLVVITLLVLPAVPARAASLLSRVTQRQDEPVRSALTAASKPGRIKKDADGCLTSFSASVDYFASTRAALKGEPFLLSTPTSTPVPSSFNFTVYYAKSYKVVQDKHSKKTFLLYQCGAPKPSSAQLRADGVALDISTTPTYSVPFLRFGIDDTTVSVFLQFLGAMGHLKGVKTYTTNPFEGFVDPCVQKIVKKLTTILPASPSVPYFSSSVSFSATSDPSPIARAKWVQYLAFFFNAETRASAVYKRINNLYTCVRKKANKPQSKPLSLWVNYQSWSNQWQLSGASFKLQYVLDAGGTNPTNKSLGQFPETGKYYNMSVPGDVASFHALLQPADIILDETYLDLGPSQYSMTKFLANALIAAADAPKYRFYVNSPKKNVWSTYGLYNKVSNYTAWYEGAVAQPQLVLQELQAIIQPAIIQPRYQHTFFYNIYERNAKFSSPGTCVTSNKLLYSAISPTNACVK